MTDPFGEQWFSEASQQALAELCQRTHGLAGEVIEVGCWTGRSTCALARAAHPHLVHAVDTWEGSPGEISSTLAQGRDVFAQFTQNIGDYTEGNVVPHRMGWRDYFADLNAPIRFLHIDAEHTYQEVFDNVTAALPLLVPGGVICGDDAHHRPIQQAILDTLGNANLVASLWYWTKPREAP